MKSCLLFLGSLLLNQCAMDYEYRWYCDNRTRDALADYLAWGWQTAYPDTTLPIDPNKANIGGVPPYTKQVIYMNGVSYEKMIKSLPKDTLSYFLILEDTLLMYDWEEIRRDYKILKRYDLSLQDLKRLNYTIPYPPDDRMKDMKMYPPYESE